MFLFVAAIQCAFFFSALPSFVAVTGISTFCQQRKMMQQQMMQQQMGMMGQPGMMPMMPM